MSKKKKKKSTKNKNNTQTKDKNKRIPIFIVAGLILVLGGYFFSDNIKKNRVPEKSKIKQAMKLSDPLLLRGGEDRPTLSPAKYTGKTAMAYNIAKQDPDLLDSMYCYCNCKKTFGHKSLLTCYVDNHAAVCDICQDQAVFAAEQYQKDKDIIKIRKAMDAKFWRPLS
jgi:hypothetical protein